jgi:biotin carboxyl carrier protein
MNDTLRYWVLAVVPVLVLLYIFFHVLTAKNLHVVQQAAFGFILGGGLSNIYDRIMEGRVVDFMNMGFGTLRTGIFNVADMSIMLGLFLMVPFLFQKQAPVEAATTPVVAEIAEEEKAAMAGSSRTKGGIHSLFFFPPVKGMASHRFLASPNHFGVDINTKKDEPVKAILEGTVIFAGWTKEAGYMIQLQHTENLVSVYKHNTTNLKKEGDRVRAGDPIAIVGNSGEQTEGPHLHFELWHKGFPVDPQDFIQFK